MNIVKDIKNMVKKIPGIRTVWNYLAEYRLGKQDVESRFTNIFLNNGWGDDSSLSGTGSNLNATESIRNSLGKIIKDYNIKTILDIPCGDFYWMKLMNIGDVEYIGADIVKPLIDHNNINFGSNNRAFVQLDIIKGDLPKSDLILCRDCLVHLSIEDINKALKNIVRSKSKYLLTTTFSKHGENKDILTGRWRPINLLMKPFNFPRPILEINEGCQENGEYGDKDISLWRIEDLIDPRN